MPNDFRNLKDMEIKHSSYTKYFKCNVCKNHQLITPADVADLYDNIQPKGKRIHIHADVPWDLGIVFKNFCNNFGSYRAGITVLLDTFYRQTTAMSNK